VFLKCHNADIIEEKIGKQLADFSSQKYFPKEYLTKVCYSLILSGLFLYISPMDEFGQEDTMPSSLEGQLFEPGVPE